MELWIAWAAIIVSLLSPIGGLFVYKVKSARAQERDKVRIEKVEEDMEGHLKDVKPHAMCGEHSVMLANIVKTLDGMDKKMDTLDQRIYDKIKNGDKAKGLPI